MIRIDSISPDIIPDGKVSPGDASAFAHAATPEQAAALYDEQARKAAALEAAIGGIGGIAALPTMSVRSLDEMTQGGDWKLARSRIKLAEPSEE